MKDKNVAQTNVTLTIIFSYIFIFMIQPKYNNNNKTILTEFEKTEFDLLYIFGSTSSSIDPVGCKKKKVSDSNNLLFPDLKLERHNRR